MRGIAVKSVFAALAFAAAATQACAQGAAPAPASGVPANAELKPCTLEAIVDCAALRFTSPFESESGRQPSVPVGSDEQSCFCERMRLSSSCEPETIRSTVVRAVGVQRSEPRSEY